MERLEIKRSSTLILLMIGCVSLGGFCAVQGSWKAKLLWHDTTLQQRTFRPNLDRAESIVWSDRLGQISRLTQRGEREIFDIPDLGDRELLAIAIDPNGMIFFVDQESCLGTIREFTEVRILSRCRGQFASSTAADLSEDGIERPGMPLATPEPVTNSTFFFPSSLLSDREGNLVIIDTGNNLVRKLEGSKVSVVAGGGFTADQADVAINLMESVVRGIYSLEEALKYRNVPTKIVDLVTDTLRESGPSGAVESLKANFDRDGTGGSARFNWPAGAALDRTGGIVLADRSNHKIKRISPNGNVTTLAGTTQGGLDGPVAQAQFTMPEAVAVLEDGTILVAEILDGRLRQITPDGQVETIKIQGGDALPRISRPSSLHVTRGKGFLFDENGIWLIDRDR